MKLHLSIDQEIFKQVFKQEVEQIFKVKDFNFNSGYIQTSVENASTITIEQLSKLKELAEICYIDFNENPVIEGTIIEQNNNVKEELQNTIGELQTKFDSRNKETIHLTIEEWYKAKTIKGVRLGKYGTARFSIKPSAKFISEVFFQRQFFLSEYENLATYEKLPDEVFEYLSVNLNLRIKSIKISITTNQKEDIDILQDVRVSFRENTTFFPYNSESGLTIILEKKKIRKGGFDTFESAIENINKFITTNFSDCDIKILPTFFYSYDKPTNSTFFDSFLDLHRSEFELSFISFKENAQFRIDQSFEAIYFDFESEEELNQKLDFVKSFSFFEIYDRGENHRYKFNIKFETGLHELQAKLKKELPNLTTKLIANGEKLIFRQFYKTGKGNRSFYRDNLSNKLNELLSGTDFVFEIDDFFQEKYLCEENFELKVEQEEEKLSKLFKTDFFVCNEEEKKLFDIGILTRVEYPNLTFTLEAENAEIVNQQKDKIKVIKPDLKGEKDKIKRLEDTVFKLDDEKTKLPNNNAKEFLYDSSKAKIIENIEYLLNKTSAEWQYFEDGIFPSNKNKLNESQKQAIFKSLYAEELALIQGPPGTGKSTAIAEIIWQHIRKAQNEKKKTKILLTSETNLAVDNAIDRLKNGENNVVKPIRFGNTDNLESEGYFYSLEAIEDWQKSNSIQNNTVSHWINNIANRISNQNNEQIDSALDKWKKHLQKPSNETKKLFAEKYLEYVNLIGATGSSIGKLNSENKWTSFFHSYLNVFEKDKIDEMNEYSSKIQQLKSNEDLFEQEIKDYKYKYSKIKSDLTTIEISFDAIIMDEASKATPPELALPILFGKKSIIVGDHRQLPPMIDGEEIKDALKATGDKKAIKIANLLSQNEFKISQFERLFTNPDLHYSLKSTFDTQYRMHPAINDVIAQFYEQDGGLKCGLPPDESSHDSFDKDGSRYHGLQFKDIITPEIHTIWIDVKTPEIQEGTSRVNFGEIDAIDNILTVLKNSEGKTEFDKWLSNKSLEEKQIGLISFYGKQIHYINKMLKEKHSETPIRLSTVDRFQGMERNIIIVSMVRSNKIASFQGQQPDEIYGDLGYPKQESLGFAESPNRLNVALSRARRLLIVVGNSEHFCSKNEIYKNVFETIQQNGKIISAEELQKAVEQNG
ncbi:MAG: AAA domain-containing protein [Chitinophagales bacterium]